MNPCTNCGADVGDENPPNAQHCGKCPPENCPDCGQLCDYQLGGQLCPCWISLEGMPLADVKALFADDCDGPGLSIDTNREESR